MDESRKPHQVVFTNKARCRDCYRCLRVCPVKAIRMQHGQANVVAERCIACGTCIRECPQHAKTFRNDLERAIRLAAEPGVILACSIAPSFAAMYSDWERKRIPSALRKLGFTYAAETSIGAFPVAQATARVVYPKGSATQGSRAHLCTACPAVVSYVEQYHSDLANALVPVSSPMIAHARLIRERLGSRAKILFIGPCVAKKAEAERPEHTGLVDCVLTFVELQQWFERQGIRLDRLEESEFDEQPAGAARLFPLPGGLARTASLEADALAADIVAISGFDDLKKMLEALPQTSGRKLIEPLFCPQGCINGPAMPDQKNLFSSRSELISYANSHPGTAPGGREERAVVGSTFQAQPIPDPKPITEEEIENVLAATGKSHSDDQLNCGACGYSSCREKAIAVIRGLAEAEMCIPWMRRLAERRTDRIIETSPNGILILDEKLHIISMNPTFRRMFLCSEAILGKHVSYLMDPEPFERIATQKESLIEMTVKHQKYNLVAHQIIYPLQEERQYVGIFVNITGSQASQDRLEELRTRTVTQARELLEHQIAMAQQMARFLGESSARGEELVENLLKLAGDPSSGTGEGAGSRDLLGLINRRPK